MTLRGDGESGEAALGAWPPQSRLPPNLPVTAHCPSAGEGGSEARICAAPGRPPNVHFPQGRLWPPQQPQGLADLQKFSAPTLTAPPPPKQTQLLPESQRGLQ